MKISGLQLSWRLLLFLFLAWVRDCNTLVPFSAEYEYPGHGRWRIEGMEPEGSNDGLPIFVFLKGTGDAFGSRSNAQFLDAMARRGFLASEVDYPSPLIEYEWFVVRDQWGDHGKDKYLQKLRNTKTGKIFPPALDVLCSKSRANCSAGVAVAGYGQGGFISLFSVQQDSRITAVMPLGIECFNDNPPPELRDEVLSSFLHRDRRLIITGGKLDNLECLSAMSGVSGCEVSGNCRTASGGGHVVVARAGRNFYSNCDPNQERTEMKCAYMQGSEPWALHEASDWLARTASDGQVSLLSTRITGCSSKQERESTEISETNSCARWVALPLFWALFVFVILLCCCAPWHLFLCYYQKICIFSPAEKASFDDDDAAVPDKFEPQPRITAYPVLGPLAAPVHRTAPPAPRVAFSPAPLEVSPSSVPVFHALPPSRPLLPPREPPLLVWDEVPISQPSINFAAPPDVEIHHRPPARVRGLRATSPEHSTQPFFAC